MRNTNQHLAGTGDVGELEDRLKSQYKMRYAVCMSSATNGLLGVALALGLRDTEFVTTPYTWGGTLAGWLLLGNRPVFADIESRTLGLDSESVRHRITPATRAILAVDIFGLPSDMAPLRRLADEYGVYYVADAAQSLGARRNGWPASSLADAVVISFAAGKTLDVQEGGAVLTNDSTIYEQLLWHTQHPCRQRRELGLHHDNEFAINSRIHPWAAAAANQRLGAVLRGIEPYREECYKFIELINSTGLTEPIDFPDPKIEPSFSRLTALWAGRPSSDRLCQAVGERLAIVPQPVRLLYRQPSFVAQYSPLLRGKPGCPEAERQARGRFAIVRNRAAIRLTAKANATDSAVVCG
jgi:dTDP-4-amino-4,6-dideoxygalactose transaminase